MLLRQRKGKADHQAGNNTSSRAVTNSGPTSTKTMSKWLSENRGRNRRRTLGGNGGRKWGPAIRGAPERGTFQFDRSLFPRSPAVSTDGHGGPVEYLYAGGQ